MWRFEIIGISEHHGPMQELPCKLTLSMKEEWKSTLFKLATRFSSLLSINTYTLLLVCERFWENSKSKCEHQCYHAGSSTYTHILLLWRRSENNVDFQWEWFPSRLFFPDAYYSHMFWANRVASRRVNFCLSWLASGRPFATGIFENLATVINNRCN